MTTRPPLELLESARSWWWPSLLAAFAIATPLSGAARAQVIEFGEGPFEVVEEDQVRTPLNQIVLNLFRVGTMESCATVRYFTVDGTATADLDYEPINETFQWCPSLQDTFLAVTIHPDLTPEPDETFEVRITVTGGASAGSPSAVTVTIVDDDQPTGPAELQIVKTDNGHQWGESPLIPYELRVTNAGGEAAAATLLEVVPARTTFDPTASTPGWACDPGPGAGSECTFDLQGVGPGATERVTFAVRVDPGTPPEFEVYNQAALERSSEASSPNGSLRLPSAASVGAAGRSFGIDIASDCTGAAILQCCFTAILQVGFCPCYLDNPEGAARREPAPTSLSTANLGTVRRPVAHALDPFLLYRLRDRVFAASPGGRRSNELFYEHIGDIAMTSARQPGIFTLANDFLLSWQPLVRALVDGQGASVQIQASHVAALSSYTGALKQNASSTRFRDFLEREEQRLDPSSWVGMTLDEWLDRTGRLSCSPSDTALCLNGGRFRAEIEWQDFDGNTGRGQAVPLTDDTGYFWFFDDDNVEVVVKALDARGINGRFWVFYGALSNVEYTLTVTDTTTGAYRDYVNPFHRFASAGDTDAFDPNAQAGKQARFEPWAPAAVSGEAEGPQLSRSVPSDLSYRRPTTAPCQASATALCLNGDRFRVEAEWADFRGNTGMGQAVPLRSDTGSFWFFGADNIELVVKVLDGRGINGHYWVFYGALSNVEYTITVTDTVTGLSRTYHNPSGEFGSHGDTAALPGS